MFANVCIKNKHSHTTLKCMIHGKIMLYQDCNVIRLGHFLKTLTLVFILLQCVVFISVRFNCLTKWQAYLTFTAADRFV